MKNIFARSARWAAWAPVVLSLLVACGGGGDGAVSSSGGGGGGGGGGTPPPAAMADPSAPAGVPPGVVETPSAPEGAPSTPTGLTIGYGLKTFKLSWTAVAQPPAGGSVSYRVTEDPDGAGAEPAVQLGGALSGTEMSRVVEGLLHTRLNAQYSVQACNSVGCSLASTTVTPDLTQAIGYFKASNSSELDDFGAALALSADGSTLAVGAPGEGSAATGVGGNQSNNDAAYSGAVYVFTRSAGSWSQQAYLKASNTGAGDRFGSVTLSGDGNTLAVGAAREGSSATGVNGADNNDAEDSGAVYVFTRSAGVWSQEAYVKASNTEASDNFGKSLTLSVDGNTLAVGAAGEDSVINGVDGYGGNNGAENSGAVYVFVRSAGVWSQQVYIKASSPRESAQFGIAVALAADGSTLAVGAAGESSIGAGVNNDQSNVDAKKSGAVYVFTRSGSTWSQQAYVKASNTEAGDEFGRSLALSGDGNTLAVGASFEGSGTTGVGGDQNNQGALKSGAVYVFTRSGSTWSQQAYVKASNTGATDQFGFSVALSADGSTLAVGALYEGSSATGVGGNQSDDTAMQTGAAYVFTRSAGAWTQKAYLKASNSEAEDYFGLSVALTADGVTLAVGAYGESGSSTGVGGSQSGGTYAVNAGAVYLY